MTHYNPPAAPDLSDRIKNAIFFGIVCEAAPGKFAYTELGKKYAALANKGIRGTINIIDSQTLRSDHLAVLMITSELCEEVSQYHKGIRIYTEKNFCYIESANPRLLRNIFSCIIDRLYDAPELLANEPVYKYIYHPERHHVSHENCPALITSLLNIGHTKIKTKL